MAQTQALVIDIGSASTKVGFAGEPTPRAVFPTVVGRPTSPGQKGTYIGQDAFAQRGTVSLAYPVQRGVVTSWDDLTLLLRSAFADKLKVAAAEYPVIITEEPLNPKANREKITQIMFDTFNVPAFYLAPQPTLALYASGRTTGLVVDVGDGVAHAVPIYEGYILPHGVKAMGFAGRDVSAYLTSLLSQRGISIGDTPDGAVTREIKEKRGYVALDFAAETAKMARSDVPPSNLMLPNGKTIGLGSELFRCAEALFNPSLAAAEATGDGLHNLTYGAVMCCDVDVRKDMTSNVLLAGGTSNFNGLPERLTKELIALLPPALSVKVLSPPGRQTSTWVGGSILGALETFSQMWITKGMYAEAGPSIVHQKCLP